jgi:hypothetical protein
MDSAGGFKAIHPWHRQIQDYNIWIECGRLATTSIPLDASPQTFHSRCSSSALRKACSILRTVIGDKYPGHGPPSISPRELKACPEMVALCRIPYIAWRF